MGAQEWLDLVKTFGLPLVMACAALWMGKRRIWVWGYQLRECQERCDKQLKEAEARLHKSEARGDRYERAAWHGTGLAESGTDVAAELADIAKRLGG